MKTHELLVKVKCLKNIGKIKKYKALFVKKYMLF